MKIGLLPLYCLLYIVDLVLCIPISEISGGFLGSLSSNIFFVVGFDVVDETDIHSMIFYSEASDVIPLLSTSSFAGAMFGVVHCLAWHFSFPSPVEQVIWRTASLAVVGSGAVTMLTILVHYLHFETHLVRGFWVSLTYRFGLICLGLCALTSFIYPIARIMLLVLAVISLRTLPPSAFATSDWIKLVPHI